MKIPVRMIKTSRDLTAVRAVIAQAVPPGEKLPLAALMQRAAAAGQQIALAWAEIMAPLADAHFGETSACVLQISTIRHHATQAPAGRAPWHTDANFFGWSGGRGLTFWLTLDDVGRTAPGVEFSVDGQAMTPIVPAGAALVIPPDVLHRTQPIDGDRISVEFRCVPARIVAPGALPQDLDVLVTERRDSRRWLLVRQGGTTAIMAPATPRDRRASAG